MNSQSIKRPRQPLGPLGNFPSRGSVDSLRLEDQKRLAAVHSTGLLDTPAEEVFDRLATVASRLIGIPYAFITLVDNDRCYWKATVGLRIAEHDTWSRQTTVESSFCRYVIITDGPVVVTDASEDEMTQDNPSVNSMGVRAWAGYPLRSNNGHVLGSLCVVDTEPRTFSADDLLILSTLAEAASREIALRSALADLATPNN